LWFYPVVIYASGQVQDQPLTNADKELFADFADAGGKVIFTGQDIAEYFAVLDNTFLAEFLGATFVSGDAENFMLNGIPGNSISDDLYVVATGPRGGANNQQDLDIITATGEAEPLFLFEDDLPEHQAGVRNRANGRDIIFLSFGLEGVNDSLETTGRREVILERLMREWEILPVRENDTNHDLSLAPAEFRIENLYPNPTNGEILVEFQTRNLGLIKIDLYDILGRVQYSESNHYSPGIYSRSISMPNDLSSGVYFVRIYNTNTYDTQKIMYLK
ncbi:T9SS type A sorting domain-containing protein, partial [bacterium]|nr:T9SS type A sorting domain-containing protein [bacterium]